MVFFCCTRVDTSVWWKFQLSANRSTIALTAQFDNSGMFSIKFPGPAIFSEIFLPKVLACASLKIYRKKPWRISPNSNNKMLNSGPMLTAALYCYCLKGLYEDEISPVLVCVKETKLSELKCEIYLFKCYNCRHLISNSKILWPQSKYNKSLGTVFRSNLPFCPSLWSNDLLCLDSLVSLPVFSNWTCCLDPSYKILPSYYQTVQCSVCCVGLGQWTRYLLACSVKFPSSNCVRVTSLKQLRVAEFSGE